jgi:hypothetical protein
MSATVSGTQSSVSRWTGARRALLSLSDTFADCARENASKVLTEEQLGDRDLQRRLQLHLLGVGNAGQRPAHDRTWDFLIALTHRPSRLICCANRGDSVASISRAMRKRVTKVSTCVTAEPHDEKLQ